MSCSVSRAGAACALLLLAAPAPAQTEPDIAPDPAAMTLFRRGRELVEAGDWNQGCERFRDSFKLYASPSTLLNLARCEEHFGRIASAWGLYQRAGVLNRETRSAERREALAKLAQEGLAELEPRLPWLKVNVADPPAELELTEADRELPVGERVPLDPGEHTLVLRAPGYVALERKVSLSEGKTTELNLSLVREPPKPAPAPEPGSKPAPALQDRQTPPDQAVPGWAWISGGVGLVLTGVAVGFGIDAYAASEDLKARCGADLTCNEDPSFDPTPLNARKNRGIGLSIGFGAAGLVGLTVAVVGITSAGSQRTARRSSPLLAGARFDRNSGAVWAGGAF